MSQSFFANDISGNKKQIWETATMGLVDMGMGIATDALKFVGPVVPAPITKHTLTTCEQRYVRKTRGNCLQRHL